MIIKNIISGEVCKFVIRFISMPMFMFSCFDGCNNTPYLPTGVVSCFSGVHTQDTELTHVVSVNRNTTIICVFLKSCKVDDVS